jgi:uncharacterized protein YjgD (DUF1641 family)
MSIAQITFKLAQARRFSQSLQIAETIKKDSYKVLSLINIAEQLAELGKFDQALQVAQTLNNKYNQAWRMAAIATKLTSAGQTELGSRILNQALEMVEGRRD